MDSAAVLRDLLHDTERLLAEAEVELHRVQERIKLLQCEQYGVQLALARVRGEPAHLDPPLTPSAAGDLGGPVERSEPASWPELSRAEAVLQLLADEGGPLGRLDIVSRLAGMGRDGDDADAVSAALAYLRRTGRVQRTGPGRWAAS